MESKAKAVGHSIHQMLVVFPVGLLLTSVAFDAFAVVFASSSMGVAAYWMLAAGTLSGFAAAPFGLIDLMAVPAGTRASRIGTWHAVGNIVVLSLFTASWAFRSSSEPAPGPAMLFSVAGALVMLMTAWMGGELVSRLGVGVSRGAHLNAQSSLLGPVDAEAPGDIEAKRAL